MPVPTPSEVLSTLLPNIRQRLDLTAQAFAERAREVGLKFDRGTVSKIENRLRGVSLDEALAIAAALDVAPVYLFLPRDDRETVAIGDIAVEALRARAWLRGDQQLPGRSDKVFRTEVPESEWNRRNQDLVSVRETWERHRRRYLIAKEKMALLSDRLGELDTAIAKETNHARMLRQYGAGIRNPAEEERDRLSRLYDAALQEVAEAKVDMEDAKDRYHTIKATIGDALRQRGHKLSGDD